MAILKQKRINPNLYILAEEAGPALVTMALIIGNDSAALIDSGCGITSTLDKLVRKLTDKPIIHLITHCDPDHAGASALFNNVYMNPADDILMANALPFEKRKSDILKAINKPFLKRIANFYLNISMVKEESFLYKNINDGDFFDLGGTVLESFSVPGHSKGSMCFINHKDQYVIAGDSITIRGNAVVSDMRCAPLTNYRDRLILFCKKGFASFDIYTGHEWNPLAHNTVEEVIKACDEILSGNTNDDVTLAPLFSLNDVSTEVLYHKRGSIGIYYRNNNL